MWMSKISLIRAGNRTTVPQYRVVTILTELSRLQLKLREEGNTTEGKPEKAIKKGTAGKRVECKDAAADSSV